MIIQHLKAPSDNNGNPRRLWAVCHPKNGHLMELIEEGYQGRPAGVDQRLTKARLVELPEVSITVGEYKRWKKYAKERHIYSPR